MKEKVREKLRKRHLNLRAVLRLAERREFGSVYDGASEADQKALGILIDDPNINLQSLKEWMANASKKPLAAWSYRKVRDLAKNNNIFNYSRLSKDELIEELEKADARFMERRSKVN